MPTLVKEAKYILSDVAQNNNKFWYIELYDNASTITRNGRVGVAEAVHPKQHSSQYSAEAFFEAKCREKERKGYTPLNVVGTLDNGLSHVQPVANLAALARAQIKTNNSLVSQLIEYFTRVNAHNICSATGGQITFSNTTGLFSTPLGIVTQANIDNANRILVSIGNLVAQRNYDYELQRLTNEYMMLIPQNIGMQRLNLHSFWAGLSAVQRQKAIVDSLQASLSQATQTPIVAADVNQESIFDVHLDLIDDDKILREVVRLYNDNRNAAHASAHLKVKKIYAVRIGSATKAFENDGRKVGNVQRLWHGTRASNVLSILKGGLLIPPSSSSHCTGRLYGDGLYFSDQSTKSLNYAHGVTWGHGSADNNCFMFLCQVALGKSYVPSSRHDKSYPVSGYDSTFAKAGVSGVINNEQIVYKTCQANMEYLIEFSN